VGYEQPCNWAMSYIDLKYGNEVYNIQLVRLCFR
jgi:hypothetical protein